MSAILYSALAFSLTSSEMSPATATAVELMAAINTLMLVPLRRVMLEVQRQGFPPLSLDFQSSSSTSTISVLCAARHVDP